MKFILQNQQTIFFILSHARLVSSQKHTQTHHLTSVEGNCIRSEVTDSIGPIASITELTVEPRRNPRESQESGTHFSFGFIILPLNSFVFVLSNHLK